MLPRHHLSNLVLGLTGAAVIIGCRETSRETPVVFGALRVTDSASGPTIPGPGYVHVRVDSGPATLLRLDSAVTLDSIPAGSADISIDLLRSQCSVPQNPVTVTITEADTAQLHFDISCQVNWGFLMVALPTTGANQPGLLIISVDGETKGGASPNTVGLGFPYILAGPHSISLSGAGPNCAIAEANPQDVVIPLDDTVHVTFTLTCP